MTGGRKQRKPDDPRSVVLPPVLATTAVGPLHSAGFTATDLTGELFDLIPNIVFFVKDATGRYLAGNRTLAERCGQKSKEAIVGRTVAELFPAELAAGYAAQDEWVVRTGQRITDKLELHLYADRRPGWCLTSKFPLHDRAGKPIGLAGLSRDIDALGDEQAIPPALADAIEYLHQHYGESLTVSELAAMAGLPNLRFCRLVKRIFHLTPSQLLLQTRLHAAAQRLRETVPA
jgi:hypothetical protein